MARARNNGTNSLLLGAGAAAAAYFAWRWMQAKQEEEVWQDIASPEMPPEANASYFDAAGSGVSTSSYDTSYLPGADTVSQEDAFVPNGPTGPSGPTGPGDDLMSPTTTPPTYTPPPPPPPQVYVPPRITRPSPLTKPAPTGTKVPYNRLTGSTATTTTAPLIMPTVEAPKIEFKPSTQSAPAPQILSPVPPPPTLVAPKISTPTLTTMKLGDGTFVVPPTTTISPLVTLTVLGVIAVAFMRWHDSQYPDELEFKRKSIEMPQPYV